MQCGPLKPALPTPGKSDVSDVVHGVSEKPFFFITAFNLSSKNQKSSAFPKKIENFVRISVLRDEVPAQDRDRTP